MISEIKSAFSARGLKQSYKFLMVKNIFLLFCFLTLTGTTLAQENGSLHGKIVDSKTGEELIGANIILEGTTIGAATDVSGNYQMNSVPPGTYNLIASMIGYAKYNVTGLKIKTGEKQKLDLALVSEAYETNEVIVTARMILNNEASLLKDRQKSNSISDAISSELITRSGSSNAGDAMTKVTGASVVDGKYVFVRGLGERYSSMQLNGSELPSADPDKKAFNMDLFPNGVLENIVTVKTFTPDKQGNFSGGLVDIATKSYPDAFTLKLSGSSSYNTTTTFNDNFLTYKGGERDWLGLDDGTRKLPDMLSNPDFVIPTKSSAWRNTENAQTIDNVTNSFSSQMSPNVKTAPVNQSYSISIGDQLELFNMPLGLLGSYTYNRDYSFYENGRTGQYKLTGNVNDVNELTQLQLLNDTKGSDEVNWGGLVTFNLKPDPKHEIGADIVYTQSGKSTARYLDGSWDEQFGQNANAVLETRVLSYTERNLQSYQLHGKHFFENMLGLGVDWSATIAKTSQDEPDTRFFTDHYSVGNDGSYNYSISNSIYALPSHYFRNMNEDSKGATLDLTLPFTVWESLPARFKFGGAFNEKQRDFTERRFQYNLAEYQYGAPIYNGNPDYYFSEANVGILWYDSTRNRYVFGPNIVEAPDARGGDYNGYQKVTALYGMVELPITNSVRFIGGARYEITNMDVHGKDTSGYLDDKDILPSASFIYQLTENMNLRASYGKTLARPNFREKAPYANFNYAGDVIFLGNPNLKRTLIDNYDIRWEWFLRPGEILAVSGFYKNFKDPIEKVINVFYTSEGGEIYYGNIDNARVMGIEIEARKRLDEIFEVLSNFSVGANVSLISSSVDIPQNELAVIRQLNPNAKSTRRLQGQSPYLVNVELGYTNTNTGTNASIFYNVFGDRLAEVSLGGTPDVFERSRPLLDFTASQNILGNFNLKLAIKNILNSSYKLSQEFKGAEYIRAEYKTGTTVSVGIGYSLN